MVGPAGPAVNNSCYQTMPSPKWIIIFFSFSVEGARSGVGMATEPKSKERKTLSSPLLSRMQFCSPGDLKSSLMWQLRPPPSLKRIPRGGKMFLIFWSPVEVAALGSRVKILQHFADF